jgi:hypothetical protein
MQSRFSRCLDDVASWMRYNRLQLNTNQTELLCAPHLCSSLESTTKYAATCWIDYIYMVSSSTSVQNLGFYIDADLSGRTQVIKTTASCFAALRQLYVEYVVVYLQTFTSLWSCRWFLVTGLEIRRYWVQFPAGTRIFLEQEIHSHLLGPTKPFILMGSIN